MLKLSEAASLALHTMAFLANEPSRQVSARQIAGELGVSEAHLAKVLQRLARYGLVESSRGPKGGFSLARSHDEVSLLEIYESVEGPMKDRHCFRSTRICNGNDCIFGDLLGNVNDQVRTYMQSTKLPDLAGVIGHGNGSDEKDNPDR